MKIFRYKADILPTAIITALFCADLVVYFVIDDFVVLIVWALLGLAPKACICAWNHHHQHSPTFNRVYLNRIIELIYAFHTGITTNAWVLHHNLGHHVNYLDQTKDESRWKWRDGTTMSCLPYTLRLAVTGYIDAYKVGKNYPKYQQSFLQMGVVVFLLLAVMFFMRPLQALIVFFVPMVIGYITTCWHTYYHHAGLDTDDYLEASYNIMHKWYNILTGNLGYHTAHHMKQALHWSKLPEFHATIEKDIPAELFVKPCFPFTLLPAK